MGAKLYKISELSKLLANKNAIGSDLCRLLSMFNLPSTLRRLSMEKQKGVSSVTLVVFLCVFRIMGDSIWKAYKAKFYDLMAGDVGKNCFYRMLGNSRMDWRRLLCAVCKQYLKIAEREGDEETQPQPKCYVIDDTTLEKTGSHFEKLSRVFDHVTGRYVKGYKLNLLGFFDGKAILPVDFSLHRERGKAKGYGLPPSVQKELFKKRRDADMPGHKRAKEADMKKTDCAVAMIKRAYKNGIRASYALMDSWFTSESLIASIRSIDGGAVHVVGLAKMDNRKYSVGGKLHNAKELILLHGQQARSCRKYKCRYVTLSGSLGAIPVRIFLIRYGHRDRWNVLVTTDTKLTFTKAFELYQIRWTIEVLNKESKQYLGLGTCQSVDFDAQVADATLCYVTYTVLALGKRFSDYETYGELFREHQKNLLGLTLWHRILELVMELLNDLAEVLGFSLDELVETFLNDARIAEKWGVLLGKTQKIAV